MAAQESKYDKYIKLKANGTVDVYRVLAGFGVKSHAIGHAIKKLLAAGERGHKDYLTDLTEAIQSIEAEIAYVREDN